MHVRSNKFKQQVTLALQSLAAIAQAERRQSLLESKAQSSQHMQAIVDRLELERAKMRVLKEISPHLS